MNELFQELALLLDLLTGQRVKTLPNLLLLLQWGVIFAMFVRVLTGWRRLEKLADTPDAPTGPQAAERLKQEARDWWRRGMIGVGVICLIHATWLIGFDSLMSDATLYIGGMWAAGLWLLNSNIHRLHSIKVIANRGQWTVQLRNLSMSLIVFVIYCAFAQHFSAGLIRVTRAAYYGM